MRTSIPPDAHYIGMGANHGFKRTAGGDVGRNTGRATKLKNSDGKAIKTIHLTEPCPLEFRADFYDMFNTLQYGTVSAGSFAPSRLVQAVEVNVAASQPRLFLKETAMDGGGQVIR